jgi:N6-L-threonylcarbamoyladenine synthase
MLILGIDTSCDDTSASVVADGYKVLSNVVSSQSEIHGKYGGIVPELASRRHIEMIWPVVDKALVKACVSQEDINAIAVCHGPGLIGSLLVGCGFSKSLAYVRGLPLMAVNHLEGHMFSVFLEDTKPEFPFLSLVVSGGHTSLYIVNGFGQYIELGRTRDDAAGEAYDKVSKLLGLGYPGGPVMDRLAFKGDPKAFDFPRAYVPDSLDFSFSGLKNAVRLAVINHKATLQSPESGIRDKFRADVAASFQYAVVEVLVRKVEWAIIKMGIRRIALSGGVSANSELRRRFQEMAARREIELFLPSVAMCTDNAAMIAAVGLNHFREGRFAGMDLNPRAYLPL